METVHVVAINPYRKGNKGKVFSYNIDTYDKVIGSEEIKKMIQQIRGELPIDGVDLNDAQAVKKVQERLKSELPFFCPHYGMFRNNVRRQENALPESFLFQTIIDVDDKEYVEKAIEKARELTEAFGPIEACLVHVRDLADVTALKHALEESGLPVTITGMMQTGPVITTHVCVGCFGFAYIPMEV